MAKTTAGSFHGKGKCFGIVVSRFNWFIASHLLDGAIDCLLRHGVQESDVEVVRVPGAFEVPIAAQKMAQSGRFHAIICLGVVIRGETPHFEYIAGEAAKGVAQVGLSTGVPAIFGVLTTENLEQAVERAGTKAGNKGWDSAMAALEMADLLSKLGKP